MMEPNEMLKIVENALYRKTPKKPEMEKYTKRELYFCPICGTDVTDCNFCPHCGQAIDWREKELYNFAKWVATEIFDDMWEYNKDSFAEIACRKLEKLGIVREKDYEWELVEREEEE